VVPVVELPWRWPLGLVLTAWVPVREVLPQLQRLGTKREVASAEDSLAVTSFTQLLDPAQADEQNGPRTLAVELTRSCNPYRSLVARTSVDW